jgi:hypothetical protein
MSGFDMGIRGNFSAEPKNQHFVSVFDADPT